MLGVQFKTMFIHSKRYLKLSFSSSSFPSSSSNIIKIKRNLLNSSLLIQKRSYIYIRVPDDEDSYFGKNRLPNDDENEVVITEKKKQVPNPRFKGKLEPTTEAYNLDDYQGDSDDDEDDNSDYDEDDGESDEDDDEYYYDDDDDDDDEEEDEEFASICEAREYFDEDEEVDLSEDFDHKEIDIAIEHAAIEECMGMNPQHLKKKHHRRIIQNKIIGRRSVDKVNALVAFAQLKTEFTLSRKELRETEEDHAHHPGISLDDEYSPGARFA